MGVVREVIEFIEDEGKELPKGMVGQVEARSSLSSGAFKTYADLWEGRTW
jgi:hypothetical protein